MKGQQGKWCLPSPLFQNSTWAHLASCLMRNVGCVGKDAKRKRYLPNLRCTRIFLERLNKATKNVDQYSRYPYLDLSLWLPELSLDYGVRRLSQTAVRLLASQGLISWSYLGRENSDIFHLVVSYVFCATMPSYRLTPNSEGDIFQHCYVPLLSAAGTSVILSFNWYFLPAVRRTAPLLQLSNLMELHSPCALISLKTTLRAPFTRMQSGVDGWEEVGRVWIYKIYFYVPLFWPCKTSCYCKLRFQRAEAVFWGSYSLHYYACFVAEVNKNGCEPRASLAFATTFKYYEWTFFRYYLSCRICLNVFKLLWKM
jgi:hypothetical protein